MLSLDAIQRFNPPPPSSIDPAFQPFDEVIDKVLEFLKLEEYVDIIGAEGGFSERSFQYIITNKGRLKVLAVNAGNGCVKPSVASVQSRAYKPLSRGLFVYSKKKAFKRGLIFQ